MSTRGIASLLLLLSSASSARAQSTGAPAPAATDELAVAAAFASSNVGPDLGGALSVRYARGKSQRLAWFVRAELVSNLRRPYGQLLKGGAAAADLGVELTSPAGPLLLLTEVAIGPRLFMEPGIGVATRAGVGLGFPLGASLRLAVGVSGEVGWGTIGDETSGTGALLRGDVWTRLGWRW